jgi:hypothetical protein
LVGTVRILNVSRVIVVLPFRCVSLYIIHLLGLVLRTCRFGNCYSVSLQARSLDPVIDSSCFFPYLSTDTDPVLEVCYCLLHTTQWTEFKNLLIQWLGRLYYGVM